MTSKIAEAKRLYYETGKTLREAGEILGVADSFSRELALRPGLTRLIRVQEHRVDDAIKALTRQKISAEPVSEEFLLIEEKESKL